MMKKLLLIAIALGTLATAAYFISARSPRPKTASAVPTPEFLAAALAKQEKACGDSLRLQYTGIWRKIGSQAPKDREVAAYTYLRMPTALRLDKVKKDGSRDFQSYDRESGEYRRLFAVGEDKAEGEVGKGPMACFSSAEFSDNLRYPLYEGPLCERIAFGTVQAHMQTLDGHACWRVDIPARRRGLEKYIAWLDPDIGFAPRRITFVWRDRHEQIVSFGDYAALGDGVWLPKRQVVTYEATTLPGARFIVVNRVTKVTRGHAIPKSQVILGFPSGTRVTDTRRLWGGEYTVP